MAKAMKRLQAILDYMKVKSITSTLHTHPPKDEEELIKDQERWLKQGLYCMASGRMGGPKVIEISYLTTN